MLVLAGCVSSTHTESISAEINKKQLEEQPSLLVFQAPSIDHFQYGANQARALNNFVGTKIYQSVINKTPYILNLRELGIKELEGKLVVSNGKISDTVKLDGTHKTKPFHSSANRILGRDNITAVYIENITDSDDLWFILINLN